jgi:hypothetical protein
VESPKIMVFILGSSLVFEACTLVKARIPTADKQQARSVSQSISHQKAGRHRAMRKKSSPPLDPEYRRLLERARRWKERQKEPRIHRVAPHTDFLWIAGGMRPEVFNRSPGAV